MAWSLAAVGVILHALVRIVFYATIWGTFTLVQACVWRLTGMHNQRKKYWKTGSYVKSAHVLDIWYRYKFSPLAQPNALFDFIAVHNRFDRLDTVLRDNVTLYAVQPKYAVFVEAEEGVDVADSDVHPFMRAAQYQNAKQLIVLPREAFDRLANTIGVPKGQMIFMGNIMRCGSTLLCQVFEKSGQCMAFSEPDVLTGLHKLKGEMDYKEFKRLTRSSINLLFKPTKAQPAAYMAKIMGLAMDLLATIGEIYPDATLLFMYRDGLPAIRSLSRLTQEEPIARVVEAILTLFPSLNHEVLALTGIRKEDIPRAASDITPFASNLYCWGSLCHLYRKLRQEGMPISAIKYEDIISNPRRSIQIIFQHCKLDMCSVDLALRAMQKDAQRNCVLSKDRLGKHVPLELGIKDKVHTDAICDLYKLPRIPQACVLEGTITH